jgi:hypothetical protein
MYHLDLYKSAIIISLEPPVRINYKFEFFHEEL